MEYVFVNDWYIYWFATTTLVIWSCLASMLVIFVVFLSSIVYDITKQVITKWKATK